MHPVLLHSPSNDAGYAKWLEIPDVTITEGEWIRLLPCLNHPKPFGSLDSLELTYQLRQNLFGVAHNRDVGEHALVDG